MARLLLVLLAAAAPHLSAQPVPAPAAAPDTMPQALAEGPAVWVVTLGQGDAIWERFGHNFLAVEDPVAGRTIAYNWGIFDFAAPDFLSRFLLGDTRYWMEGTDLNAVVQYYQQFDRSITMQRVAMSAAQADSLRAFLEWNARPENRYYRYDYFRDNCSTRLRDALDLALGGELRRVTQGRLTNQTYRSESLRLTDEAPASQLGIAVALGQPADRLLSAWESMFVPMRLQEVIRDVEVRNDAGELTPLVLEEREIYVARRAPERERAPSLLAELGIPGLLIAAGIAALGRAAGRGSARARTVLGAVGGAWGGIAGVIGIVLTLAWAATHHVYWYRNENLFHFNPLALALVVLLPLATRNARWWPAARMVAFGIAGLSVAGAVLKLMPWMLQENWAMIFLALPINVALAWAVNVISPLRAVPRAPRGRRAGESVAAA